ncbi:MAG: hypothetical protein ABEJ31_09770 [Haloarculaceae archaeon]
MSDEFGRPAAGQRARAVVEGEPRTGTVSSVTYTPKGGQPVVEFSLDDPTAQGTRAVALSVADLSPIDD